MVVALAGRRIDAPQSPDRSFPVENVWLVRERIRDFFSKHEVAALVCSAAAGADLLALDEAGAVSISRHVVLPFNPERFRETSVADRPGDWGSLYDRILAELDTRGDVTVLSSAEDGDDAYAAVNDAILNKAATLGMKLNERTVALLVWNGLSRGDADLTQAFGEAARARGVEVIELSTSDVVSQKGKL